MLSIIIPVFNGEKNLVPLLERIEKAAVSTGQNVEILFIDDKSTDGSLELIKRIAAQNNDHRIKKGWISLKENRGQQTAVLCGLRSCSGDFAVTIDDDLEHPPELIPLLYSQIKHRQVDAVYAVAESEKNRERTFVLRIGSFLRDLFFVILLRKPVSLRIGSYRIFSREAVEKITETDKPFVYISAELLKKGCRAEHLNYKVEQPVKAGRYSSAARIRLYLKLIWWYSIGFYLPLKSIQYSIAEKGGCL